MFVLPKDYRKNAKIEYLPDQGRKVISATPEQKKAIDDKRNQLERQDALRLKKLTGQEERLSPIVPQMMPRVQSSQPIPSFEDKSSQMTGLKPIKFVAPVPKPYAPSSGGNKGVEEIGKGLNVIGNSLMQGIGQTDIGILNALRTINKPFAYGAQQLNKLVTGKKAEGGDLVSNLLDKGVEKAEQGTKFYSDKLSGLSGAPKILSNAVSMVPGMLPGMMTGNLVPTGIKAFGSGAREAEREGANFAEQVGYGLGTSGLEVATEIAPFARMLKVWGGAGKPFKEIALGAIEEFIGEGASEALNPFIKRATYNPQAELASMQEIAEAGLTGVAGAVMMGGIGLGLNSAIQSVENKDFTPQAIQAVGEEIKQTTGVDLKTSLSDDLSPLPSKPTLNSNIQETPLEKTNRNENVYSGDMFIDNRTFDEVSSRKVKAFMHDNPEYKPLIQNRAKELLGDLKSTVKGRREPIFETELVMPGSPNPISTYAGVKRQTSNAIARILDDITPRPTYSEVENALNRIIEDNGRENTALSKKIELVIDEDLSNGYTAFDNTHIEPNLSYLLLKDRDVPGYFDKNYEVDGEGSISPKGQYSFSDNLNIDSLNTVSQLENALSEIESIRQSDPETYSRMNLQLFAEQVTEKLNKIRQTYENSIMKSKAIPQGFKDQLKPSDFEYDQVSNKDQWGKAVKKVNSDNQGSLLEFMQKDKLGGEKGYDTALGEALLFKYTKDGDFDTANKVAIHLSEMMTDAGQTVQAMAILKRLTPEGMLYYANKTLNDANAKLGTDVELSPEESQFINDVMQEVQNKDYDAMKKRLKDRGVDPKGLSDTELEDINIKSALQLTSDKVPLTFEDKHKAFRRLMMLLNPKTQVRNVAGNTIFGILENVNQVTSAGIDKIISKVYGTQRQTTLPQLKAQKSGMWEGSKNALIDYKLGIDRAESRGRYELLRTKTVFKNQSLNKANNFLSFIMTLGDTPFFQAAYNERVAEYNKLGIELNTETQAQAAEFALERVFQDNSSISQMAMKVRQGLNTLGPKSFSGGDMVMPFVQTPANILAKGLEYTPLNIVNNIKSIPTKSRISKGKFNQKKFTDSLARTLTGTGIATVGYLLAKNGLATGGYDKKKDKEAIENLAGESNYSIRIGDTYHTFDWAEPASIPLAVGVDFYIAGKTESDMKQAFKKGFISAGNTLFNQSMLQGLNRLMGGYSPTQGIIDTVIEAPTQYLPTLGGQIARTIDPLQRRSDTVKDRAFNKLPLLRQLNEPKLDVFGNELLANQGRNTGLKTLENFFLPNYISKKSEDRLVNELLRLSKESGDLGFLPNVAPKSFTADKIDYKLTVKQQNEFQKVMGKINYDGMNELISSAQSANSILNKIVKPKKSYMDYDKPYSRLTEEEKAEALRKIDAYSYKKAKEYIMKQF